MLRSIRSVKWTAASIWLRWLLRSFEGMLDGWTWTMLIIQIYIY